MSHAPRLGLSILRGAVAETLTRLACRWRRPHAISTNLVIVDAFTRLASACAISDEASRKIAERFYCDSHSKWVCRFGPPERLLSEGTPSIRAGVCGLAAPTCRCSEGASPDDPDSYQLRRALTRAAPWRLLAKRSALPLHATLGHRHIPLRGNLRF